MEREIDVGEYDSAEDINFDMGEDIKVKGVYYSVGRAQDPITSVVSSGLWSRGQSDDWTTLNIIEGATKLTVAALAINSTFLFF